MDPRPCFASLEFTSAGREILIPSSARVLNSTSSSAPQAVAPRPCLVQQGLYPADQEVLIPLLRPQAVAPRPLWRLPPPASVASSPPFFSAPGSGSPSPVEVAPAGLCRVVASFFFTAPGSGFPAFVASPRPCLGFLGGGPARPLVLISHL